MIAMSKRDGASVKREPFGDRVRRLLADRNMTQSELAEISEIAPAGLSRILSNDNERSPTLAHVLAIAEVLKVTAVELVGGTSAEEVLAEWIPRDRFEASERAKLDAQNALGVARANIASRDEEIGVLRARVNSLAAQCAELETDFARQQGELQHARGQAEKLAELTAQAAVLAASNEGLQRRVSGYEEKLTECHAKLTAATRAYEEARARVGNIQRELIESKNGHAGALAVAAVVGGIFGVAIGGKKL